MTDEPIEETPASATPDASAPDRPSPPAAVPSQPRLRERMAGRLGRALGPLLLILVGIGIGSMLSGGEEAGHADHAHGGPAAPVSYTCSMHPQVRMDQPGTCPICGMDLVEASSGDDDQAAPGEVTLSPRAQALAQIQTTEVGSAAVVPQGDGRRLLGRVDHDESRLRTVTAWTAGRIDRLRVRTTGARIGRNQVIARLYSPEVYAAMGDLVAAGRQAKALSKSMHGAGELASAALESARNRLRLLGVPDPEIAKVEESGEAPSHVDIRSPFGGTVLERMVEEGDYVSAGTPLFSVADLSRVWIQIDAYESDLPHVAVGQAVAVTVESLPGETLEGKVAFIDPVVDPRTRTTRVRVEVPNRGGRLRPGMFATATVSGPSGDPDEKTNSEAATGGLTVPATAVLFTGPRSVVYVEVPGRERPTYAVREVVLGPRSGDVYPVKQGLKAGERVVTRGAFAVDADLQLQGGPSMMTRDGAPMETTAAMQGFLVPVVRAYLDLAERLSADDRAGARAAATALHGALGERPPSGDPGVAVWNRLVGDLHGAAKRTRDTETIAEARKAFEGVSMGMKEVLGTFGNPVPEPLRLAFCPMAFDDRGAEWIQSADEIHNPYFGEEMYACGMFRGKAAHHERLHSRHKGAP